MKCRVCKAPVAPERAEYRGPYCTQPDCVSAGLLARSNQRPMVLVNQHKAGYEPAFLTDVRKGAFRHPKKG